MLFTILGVVVSIGVAWFIPWVFTLHLGVLVYFPYQPKSEKRYLRITGPLAGSQRKNWVPSQDIPKACKLALVAAEDTKFFIHHGVDLESIEKSYEYNQRKKKPKRGGSTITQQLVKNAFLSREKSYVRKAREIVGAIMLDSIASKDMQLTWYFNVVEFGPKIYGIKDAAQYYFKKSHTNLSVRECSSLVAILPSPNRWNKSLKSRIPSNFLASRIETIQARMKMIPTDEDSAPLIASKPKQKPPKIPGEQTTPTAATKNEKLKQLEIRAEQAEDLDLPEEPDLVEDSNDTENLMPSEVSPSPDLQSHEITVPSQP